LASSVEAEADSNGGWDDEFDFGESCFCDIVSVLVEFFVSFSCFCWTFYSF
jgi:hypothetical protein